MKKLFTFLSVLLCLALYSGAMAENFCWIDDYGCYVTLENEQKSYLMFWSEAARQTVMGNMSQPGDLVVVKPTNHSERLPLDPAPSPTPDFDATLAPTALPTVVPTAVPTVIPTVAPAERWLDSPFTAEDGTRCLEAVVWSATAMDMPLTEAAPGWPWTEQQCIDNVNNAGTCGLYTYNGIYMNLDETPTAQLRYEIEARSYAYGCGWNKIFPKIDEEKCQKLVVWGSMDMTASECVKVIDDMLIDDIGEGIEPPESPFYACYYNYVVDVAIPSGVPAPVTMDDVTALYAASGCWDYVPD